MISHFCLFINFLNKTSKKISIVFSQIKKISPLIVHKITNLDTELYRRGLLSHDPHKNKVDLSTDLDYNERLTMTIQNSFISNVIKTKT